MHNTIFSLFKYVTTNIASVRMSILTITHSLLLSFRLQLHIFLYILCYGILPIQPYICNRLKCEIGNGANNGTVRMWTFVMYPVRWLNTNCHNVLCTKQHSPWPVLFYSNLLFVLNKQTFNDDNERTLLMRI